MRFYFVFFLVLTMALGGSAIAAFADSGTGASVTVSKGSLNVAAPATVAATSTVTLSGDDQTTQYSMNLSVTDATGSSAGWNLQISATQFSDGTHTLPADAQYITTLPTATCTSSVTDPTHCTAPTNDVTYAGGSLTVTTAAQPLFNATAGTGRGKFSIPTTVKVEIPANTVIGAGPSSTFSSTVTVAIASGPN